MEFGLFIFIVLLIFLGTGIFANWLCNFLNKNKHQIINNIILLISKGIIIFLLILTIMCFIKGWFFGVVNNCNYQEDKIYYWWSTCGFLYIKKIGAIYVIIGLLFRLPIIISLLPFSITYIITNSKYKNSFIKNKWLYYLIIIFISIVISYFIIKNNYGEFTLEKEDYERMRLEY